MSVCDSLLPAPSSLIAAHCSLVAAPSSLISARCSFLSARCSLLAACRSLLHIVGWVHIFQYYGLVMVFIIKKRCIDLMNECTRVTNVYENRNFSYCIGFSHKKTILSDECRPMVMWHCLHSSCRIKNLWAYSSPSMLHSMYLNSVLYNACDICYAHSRTYVIVC